jgi:hypothetical protein
MKQIATTEPVSRLGIAQATKKWIANAMAAMETSTTQNHHGIKHFRWTMQQLQHCMARNNPNQLPLPNYLHVSL